MKGEYEGFSEKTYFPKSYWNRRSPSVKLDTITANESDLIRASRMRGDQNSFWRLMEEPALPHFSLIMKTSEDPNLEIRYDYEPVSQESDAEISDEGAVSIPKTACRISARWSEKPWWTPMLGTILGVLHDDRLRAPSAKFEWLREGSADADLEAFASMQMRYSLGIYTSVQALFKNRPEVFVTKSVPASSLEAKGNGGKYHGRKHKAKMCRVITLDGDKLPNTRRASGCEYTCPCWGVIGHVRHYKSGKEVWIAPYRKGRQRDDPGAYTPKEYIPYREDEE